MSSQWNSLPLLPLRSILHWLQPADALSATATCRQWRQGILFYEGHRDTLTLTVSDIPKTFFLSELFGKSVQRLVIRVDTCSEDLEDFMRHVLTKFYDSEPLQEVVFIGPDFTDEVSANKFKRLLIEYLVQAQPHDYTFHTVSLSMPVDISAIDDEIMTSNEDEDSLYVAAVNTMSQRRLEFDMPDKLRSSVFTSLQRLALDYSTLDSDVISRLSNLPSLSHISLSLSLRPGQHLRTLNWRYLTKCHPNKIKCSLNIIRTPESRFDEIIENVLVNELPLVAIRVMFCKTLHEPLIKHVTAMYNSSLLEFHYIDAPATGHENFYVPSQMSQYDETCVINPFVLVCWRCTNLQKLTVHGYWVWQFDLVGMVRLRASSLRSLATSALNGRERRPDAAPQAVLRRERLRAPAKPFVQEINRYLKFVWRPNTELTHLHPALTHKSTESLRDEYIAREIAQPLGVT